MATDKTTRTLFFIDGPMPSEKEQNAADKLKGTVCFRNAHHVPADGALEAADFVSGIVPQRYYDAYEHVGSAKLYTDNPALSTDTVNAGEAVGNEVSGQLSTAADTSTPATTDPAAQELASKGGKAVPLPTNDRPGNGITNEQAVKAEAVKAAGGTKEEVAAAAGWGKPKEAKK